MSLYNLERMFKPVSVAVVGASEKPGSIGRAVLDNLAIGGFGGRIIPVNPMRSEVLGRKAFPRISEVEGTLDLAVICTPISIAPEIIRECGAKGVGGAIIISGGGKEAGEDGRRIEAEIIKEAYAGRVRIVGPNCVGVVSSGARLNASFGHTMPLPGKLAFISQSGAICTAILDFAVTERIGFSHMISVGSMLDVDFGDLIDYLGNDEDVSGILLYIESVTNHRKFMSAARAVSRLKPIIALKMGRSQAGIKAAASHTGSMAGEDAVYETAFKRAGIIRVETIEDLFGTAELTGKQPLPQGDRLAIISNAGGPGVMAADYLASYGMEPVQPSQKTVAELDKFLPSFWSHANPFDILGDASPDTFRRVVQVCLASGEYDAALIMTCPQAMNHPTDMALQLTPALKGMPFPVFTVWMGGREMASGREIFNLAGIPTYDTPERAIRAFRYMYLYGRNLKTLQEVPPKLSRAVTVDQDKARGLIAGTLEQGRDLMTEVESKELLAAYGIPVTETRRAGSRDEAVTAAGEIGYPVAMKILSPQITHKSDAGGVSLNLRRESDVRQAYERIMESCAKYDPQADLLGVTLQPMIRESGVEVILGLKKDPDFGPVLLFGMGGIMAELIKDRSLALPPLNRLLARRMMEETKVYRLLTGFRNIPPADLNLLEEILIRLSQMAVDLPRIAELDINPLLVTADSCLALDARVILRETKTETPAHLVISAYPDQYEQEAVTSSGLALFIRPIRPEDHALMVDFWHALSPDSVYNRFLRHLKSLPPGLVPRHTQIDYDREMALVALDRSGGGERIVGVARLVGNPDGIEAELGMSVGDEWQGKGVAETLLSIILPIARERGWKRVWNQVFAENEAALALAEKTGAQKITLEEGRLHKLIINLEE